MTALNRVVVLSLVLSAASAGLAMRAASPSLRLLRAEREQAEQRAVLLKRILTNADRFDTTLVPPDDRSPIDDSRGSNEVREAVNDFRQVVVRLCDRVRDREYNALDVEEVLQRGAGINSLTARHQLSARAGQAWLALRADLDRLAKAHTIAWDWSTVQATAPPPAAVTADHSW